MKPGIDYIKVRPSRWGEFARQVGELTKGTCAPGKLLGCDAVMTYRELIVRHRCEFTPAEVRAIEKALAHNDPDLTLRLERSP